MSRRYRRSNRLKYKRRRQRAGFALFVSLAVVMLGGLIFMRMEPYQRVSEESQIVQRPETPTVAKAPGAAELSSHKTSEEKARAAEARREKAKKAKAKAEKRAEAKKAEERAEKKAAEKKKEEEAAAKEQKKQEEMQENPPNPATDELYLTIPKLGKYGEYVVNDTSEASLYNGPGKITETGFPWQPSANTYIASHVLGYSGTGSYMDFAGLPNMAYGDQIILSDSSGTEYVYQVTNMVTVSPSDTSVTKPTPGKPMVSLQTCVGPGWSSRLVVQADRVSVQFA